MSAPKSATITMFAAFYRLAYLSLCLCHIHVAVYVFLHKTVASIEVFSLNLNSLLMIYFIEIHHVCS